MAGWGPGHRPERLAAAQGRRADAVRDRAERRAARDAPPPRGDDADVVVIEQVESYGMAVGREVFETVRWAGRFEEAARRARRPAAARAVKLAICSSPKANDSNIRAALLDRYGGTAAGRIGGPLAGIVKDLWSALAIAVTYAEQVAA
jgi:hypothetical protein